MTNSGQIYENYSSERKIKARRVKVIETKGYNSKIVSADKDWREEVLILRRLNAAAPRPLCPGPPDP